MKRFEYTANSIDDRAAYIGAEIMSTNGDCSIVVDENAVRVKLTDQLGENINGNEENDITLEAFNRKVVERLTALAAANNGLTQEQLDALAALSNVNNYVKKSGDPQKVESEITFKDGIYITDNTDTAAISLDEKFDIFTAGLGLNVDEGVYAAKFVKDGGTNTEVLLADGTTKALSEIGGNGGGYNKPADGIPASDMTVAVQESLAKANTAVQPDGNKGLSTNDFTDAYKAVLDGAGNYATQTWVNGRIEEINATGSTQVNSDWNAVDGVAQILNKPTLGSLASLSGIDYNQLTGNLERDLNSALGQNGTIDVMLTYVNTLKSKDFDGTWASLSGKPATNGVVANGNTGLVDGGVVYSALQSYALSSSIPTLLSLMGLTAKGSTIQPIYWTGSAFANTTYTLGASVPSNAKFTDTTYNVATQSANGLMSYTDKKKLDGIDTGANNYTLPAAQNNRLGGVKVKSTVNEDITGSIYDGSNMQNRYYGVKVDKNGLAFVNVPWTDTTYTIPTVDSALSGTSTNAVQNKVINAALAGKADQSDLEQKANASDLTALSNTVSGKQDEITTSNAASVRTTLGLGTLATQNSIAAATTSAAGLMSATDKAKLDGIASGATANSGTITAVKMNNATVASSGIADLGNVVKTIQLNGSNLTNTSGVVNIPGSLIAEALGGTGNSGLATVAWSGDYDDLENKPTIPNTSNFITKSNSSDAYSWLLRANGQSITMEDLATEIGVGLFSGETQSGTGKNGIVAAPNKVGDYEGDIKYLSASGDWIYSKASGGDLVSKYGLTTDRTDSGTYQLYYETPLERLAIYTTTSSGRRWIDSDGYTIRRCILVGTTLSWQHVCKRKGTLKEMPRYLDLDPTYDQGYPFYLTPINKQLYAKITVETSKIYTNGSWKSINIYNYRWTDSEGRTWVISWHHDGMSSSQLYAYDSTNKRYNTDNNILAIDSSFDKLVDTETTTLSNITISEYAGSSTDYSNCRTGLFTKDDLGRYFAKGSFYSDLYMLSGILVTDSNIDDNHTNNGVYSRTYKYTLINVNGDDNIQYTLTISHLKK